jgi:putative redox protein
MPLKEFPMAVANANVKVKKAVYNLTGKSVSHARTDISVRDVMVTTDEPLERGGTNTAPSPTETMIAALLGCTNNVATRIAHHKGLEFEINTIEAEVEFDRRGVILEEDIAVPFPRIALTINVRTTATPAQLEEVEKVLPIYCPVSKVFQAAGTDVTETWNIVG